MKARCSNKRADKHRLKKKENDNENLEKATGRSVNTIVPILDDGETGAAHLTVTIRENERIVRSVNLPQIGKSLVFEPLTKTEREMFAKAGKIEAVPVITAKN